MKLSHKIALVTGAGRGIGREVALDLARNGADLILHYSGSEEGARSTAQEIRDLGRKAWTYRADLGQSAQIKDLFRAIDEAPGQLDILVNCAGISGGGPLEAIDLEQARRVFEVNTIAPLVLASEAARRLGDGGRIINVSSTLASYPIGGCGVYSASKAALESFTQSWAKDLGRKGVTVNTVVPGATSPGMGERMPQQYREFYERASPFGRIGRADEIAAVISFLASPEASWVSGATILANGAANA